MMHDPARILIMGASYGSLLATKLLLAGHSVHLVCRTATSELINREGTRVRLPVKGREGLVEVSSQACPGKLKASVPQTCDPAQFDLVVLAMQEPQYAGHGVRDLLDRVARSGVPAMSIMNMPPLPYLKRIPGLDTAALRSCFADATVWDAFQPDRMTLCSPDPQAFRPADEKANVLQVRLPTNFRTAGFESGAHTQLLRRLEADIDGVRYDIDGTGTDLPVKLKVFDSIFVPLAKWAMLLAGNYRCVGRDGMRSIKEAVHGNLAASRSIYDWVAVLCTRLGADPTDLVPFDKYAQAALSLASPSSAARALAGGSMSIERVDRLVQIIGAQHGMQNSVVDETVALVDLWLTRNRSEAAAAA